MIKHVAVPYKRLCPCKNSFGLLFQKAPTQTPSQVAIVNAKLPTLEPIRFSHGKLEEDTLLTIPTLIFINRHSHIVDTQCPL